MPRDCCLGRRVCRRVALLLVTGILVLAITPTVLAQPPDRAVADELLVGFHPDVSRGKAERAYGHLGAARLEEFPNIHVHRIRVPAGSARAVENFLRHHPEVRFVEPNLLHPPDLSPNDTYYVDQWHLPQISASWAWDLSQGSPAVVVAILDSGVDPTHPDLATKLVPGYNFWDGTTKTADVYGHGTQVAGVAAAIGNNGTGVASVAWRSSIMPVRVTGVDGWASTSTIAKGLSWAVDHGARVMNVSFGSVAGSSTIKVAAQYVVSRGGVVVAAAGNCGCWDPTPDNPYIVSVSATNTSDTLASWSSRGDYVDVSAPGTRIKTTARGGGYATVAGTSFASPIVAGVVALMLSVNPTLTPSQVEAYLQSTADDLGSTGWDPFYGAGRVNAYRALVASAGGSPDLQETAVSSPPAVAAPSTSFAVTDSVENRGTALAGASKTRYFLSLDTTRSAADTRIGSRDVPGLGPGESSTGTATVRIPATVVPGTYYLLACADVGNGIKETSEKNNCLAAATRVTVTP